MPKKFENPEQELSLEESKAIWVKVVQEVYKLALEIQVSKPGFEAQAIDEYEKARVKEKQAWDLFFAKHLDSLNEEDESENESGGRNNPID